MIVSDTYEESRARSLVDSGAHGRLTNDRRGRQMKLNPASISQYPSSTLQDNETYAKLPRDFAHCPFDYYDPPNSRSDDSQLCRAGSFLSPTSEVPNIEGATLNLPSVYRGNLEESGLQDAGPSQFRPSFDDRDLSPTDGSILPLGSPFDLFASASVPQPPTSLNPGFGLDCLSFSKTLPHIPSAETNVTRVIPGVPLPLLDGHPPIQTRSFSLTGSHPSGFGDQNSPPTPVAIHGMTEDSRMETASFEKMVMDLNRPLSNQGPGFHTSGAHLPNSTFNDFSLPDTNFTHDKEAPPDFRLDRQGHQLATVGGFTPPPSCVLTYRDRKKYWCQPCEIGFSQKQGFTRHNKDKHLQRNLCPYCRNFKWSPGRLYKLKAHLKENHPDAAPPWS